jgi:hypothetical protein
VGEELVLGQGVIELGRDADQAPGVLGPGDDGHFDAPVVAQLILPRIKVEPVPEVAIFRFYDNVNIAGDVAGRIF